MANYHRQGTKHARGGSDCGSNCADIVERKHTACDCSHLAGSQLGSKSLDAALTIAIDVW
eukprot:scaffold166696_cov31-Tisochrysis_lutea.AAC.2